MFQNVGWIEKTAVDCLVTKDSPALLVAPLERCHQYENNIIHQCMAPSAQHVMPSEYPGTDMNHSCPSSVRCCSDGLKPIMSRQTCFAENLTPCVCSAPSPGASPPNHACLSVRLSACHQFGSSRRTIHICKLAARRAMRLSSRAIADPSTKPY